MLELLGSCFGSACVLSSHRSLVKRGSGTEKYSMRVERWGNEWKEEGKKKENAQIHLLQSSLKVNICYTFIKSLCKPGLYANLH